MRDMSMRRHLPPATRFAIAPPLVFVLALAVGCSTDSPAVAGDLTTTIDTVDGVVRVTNSGTAPEWQLTPVVSIGPKTLAVGDGGPEEFGEVSSVAIGPDNEVFVGDALNGEVRSLVWGAGTAAPSVASAKGRASLPTSPLWLGWVTVC